jgi:NAD(P)-dependent dehydrogenase (short-subunit alcohol dehydrogenase family)
MPSGLKIEGRVALVTGANRGIGLALVEALLGRGARKIYAATRKPEALADLAASSQGAVVPLRLDITHAAEVQQAAAEAEDVDVLINNAAVVGHTFGGFEDPIWLDAARQEYETNVVGALRLSQAFAPVLARQGGGAIVNVSSVAGRAAAIPMQSAYSASKHGLCVLTDAINAECGAFGVRAVCIEPGFTATSIMKNHSVSRLEDDDPYKPVLDNIEQLFRAGLAAAASPDVVATMIAAAIDGSLTGGTHFPVNVPGLTATTDAGRGG